MPRRTIELRFGQECTSFFGPRPHFSPLDISSSFDNAFRAEVNSRSVRILVRLGNEDAVALCQCGLDFGLAHDLRKMRRTDLLFAFRDEDEIHWQIFPGRANACNAARKADSGPF